MTIQAGPDFPVTFRSDVVRPILGFVAAGDSCSVVGIGSVGKSNLLRFLQREDVRRAQFGDEWANYLFVYVDINKILKVSRWGLFELMLHQLLVELTNRSTEEAVLEAVDELHQRATHPKMRNLALRYLDRAIGLVCNQLRLRLVFLIDEFDDLCRIISPRGFAALRALRDDYKYRLMYVVATRWELKRLRDEVDVMEAFEELVSSHTIWLGPYPEEDALFVLKRLGARYREPLRADSVTYILSATGGHPGLLRAAYNVVRARPGDFSEMLVENAQVQDECRRIWLSLTAAEQRAMISLSGEAPLQPEQAGVVERLRRKGLVYGDDHQIFSALFEAYIKQQNPVVGARIFIDHKRRIVSVNGHEVRGLTPLEFELMAYLEKNRGRLVSRDELAQHLYPEDMAFEGEGVTDTRMHSLVKRLRRRIEPNPKKPRYIITVRGHGFRMADGDEVEPSG